MRNLRNIMKRAWEIKRQDSRNIFAECLKMAWAEAKKVVTRFAIPAWFMEKNADKVTTENLICFNTFNKNNIVKETEKAIQVELEMMTRSGMESRYTKKVWVPKSIIETYSF